MTIQLRKVLAASACLWIASCGSPPPAVTVSTATSADAAGLIDISRLIADAALDIRYSGADNFVGAPVDGYDAPKCYLLAPVAAALARVEQALRKENLRIRIFDCYRPVRAVRHFGRWAEDLADQRTKATHYPNLDKRSLLGVYIARTSGHSRGATIDLGLLRCDDEGRTCTPLDMGTPFDFFDELAHTDSPAIGGEQRTNRHRLVDAMRREGFENYAAEWWHYTYRPEPSPTVAYDVPVQ
ncbi:MAG: M15 family metallopeptidase [Steroidobacter sp.]